MRASGRDGENTQQRGIQRMRWDYRDNGSRWREVKAPPGLSTPHGLKDFNRATNNQTDDALLTLQTPS